MTIPILDPDSDSGCLEERRAHAATDAVDSGGAEPASIRPSRPDASSSPAERGQSAAEFVLVLPVLLALLVGIIELGNIWRTYQITTNVAREGARLAILPSSTQSQVSSDIQSRLQASGLDSTKASIVYNDGSGLCDGTGCTGDSEAVRLDYPYDLPLLGGVLRLICGSCGDSYGTVTLSTEAVMRNE